VRATRGAEKVVRGSTGGERGIRTLDTVSRIHAFQACAFSHSATSPCRCFGGLGRDFQAQSLLPTRATLMTLREVSGCSSDPHGVDETSGRTWRTEGAIGPRQHCSHCSYPNTFYVTGCLLRGQRLDQQSRSMQFAARPIFLSRLLHLPAPRAWARIQPRGSLRFLD
jgi:hypothetical protein